MQSGVPQLSLGEKAILIATPDYVCLSLRSISSFLTTFFSSRSIGLWLAWLPTGDTSELDVEVRSGVVEDQLADSTLML
jgi:hypothetical protein